MVTGQGAGPGADVEGRGWGPRQSREGVAEEMTNPEGSCWGAGPRAGTMAECVASTFQYLTMFFDAYARE